MTRLVRNTQSREQFTLFFLSQEIFSCGKNFFPVTRNILSFTGKISCDTICSFLLLCQEINFLWQEIFFLSQEKFLLWKILYFFCHKRYSSCQRKLFCDMGIFYVTGNAPPITTNTVCITWSIVVSVTGMIFHFASSQEIFFLLDKEIIFSCDTRCTCTSCNRICSSSGNEYSPYVYQHYFLSPELFSCERE